MAHFVAVEPWDVAHFGVMELSHPTATGGGSGGDVGLGAALGGAERAVPPQQQQEALAARRQQELEQQRQRERQEALEQQRMEQLQALRCKERGRESEWGWGGWEVVWGWGWDWGWGVGDAMRALWGWGGDWGQGVCWVWGYSGGESGSVRGLGVQWGLEAHMGLGVRIGVVGLGRGLWGRYWGWGCSEGCELLWG